MTLRDWFIRDEDWDPWRELARVQRAMHQALQAVPFGPGRAFPAVNLWSDDDRVVVTAELPGVARENLTVSVEGGVLTLRGSREAEPPERGGTVLRRERRQGPFARSLALPFAVDAQGVQATYQNGVLRIAMPRSAGSRPRKIEITD